MNARRFFLAVLAVLACLPALAASVAERSPFAQGHWWNPARSGSGFDMFNAGGRVMVIWYTYDAAGRPIWYTAQGEESSLGQQDWPLQKHFWANGRKAGFTAVGTLRLTVTSPEAAEIAWDIGGQKGTWPIQPFIVSGVTNELDRGGSWFDPANSGWGINILEQGDVKGGVLFAYDTAGNPTWFAGFDRNANGTEFQSAAGACPACTYQGTTYAPAGKLSFDSPNDDHLTLRSSLTVPLANGVLLEGPTLSQLSRPASSRAADRQLARFDSDDALRGFLVQGMYGLAYRSGGVDFSAAPPASTYSTTNLQEAGVDEADLMKTDGRYIYALADVSSASESRLRLRIAEVSNQGALVQDRGSVPLATAPLGRYGGLYLHGDKVIALSSSVPSYYFTSPWLLSGDWVRGSTTVEVLSTANPTAPVASWRVEIEGNLISSRRIGDRLYIVSRYVPYLPDFSYGMGSTAANRQLAESATLEQLLPRIKVNGGAATRYAQAASVYAPPLGTRAPQADLVLVTAIDLAAPSVAQTLVVAGFVDAIYAAPASLYLASTRYPHFNIAGTLLPDPPFSRTDIHKIRLGATSMQIVGSGSVEGYLGGDIDKAAFRLSEHLGQLRVVTGSANQWLNTKNRVTVLAPSAVTPGLLKTVGYLPNAARPEPLGKPGEMLYGTRFLGDRLYAVTFRVVDPLYVVDLSNGADPKIAGALEVPGFSEYLHPLPNGLLLGFGKDATATGLFQGLQLSLYDVSDPNRPRELQRQLLGKRGSHSALLTSHLAFSMLPSAATSLIAFPAALYDGPPGAPSYPFVESGLMRFELRGSSAADARLVQVPGLITRRASVPYTGPDDGTTTTGRSILFPAGTLYLGNGRFWHQDANGMTVGPF